MSNVDEYVGAVALLDALGTKGAWRIDIAKTLKNWALINEVLDHAHEDSLELVTNKLDFADIEMQKDSFSDTIIITARHKDNKIDGNLLLYISAQLNGVILLGLNYGLLFRGCMSIGKYYRGKQMVIGPAVDEAANYYQLPNWVGLSATPSAHLALNKSMSVPYLSRNWVRYNIPFKTGYDNNGWALNWPYSVIRGNSEAQIRQAIERGIEEHATDIDVAFKLRNTLDFLTYVATIGM